MFNNLETLPPDPILGLSAAFKQDPRSEKIDLGVGVYKDAQGNTPVMAAVKEAERQFLGIEVWTPSTAVSPTWCWAPTTRLCATVASAL